MYRVLIMWCGNIKRIKRFKIVHKIVNEQLESNRRTLTTEGTRATLENVVIVGRLTKIIVHSVKKASNFDHSL